MQPGLAASPSRANPPAPLGSRRTRVGLVGTGYVAETHLEILRELPGIELVALCDVDLERARTVAARHGVARVAGSIGELAELGLDALHLCVPPDQHGRCAREALERGLSVLVEKPLVLSALEARELGQLARDRGLVLGANHNSLFHPAFARLCGRLRSGAIGRIEHVEVQLAVPLRQLETRDHAHWMFRAPGNIVFEQAVHPFAQLVELLGRPQEVHARVLATRQLLPGQDFHERWAVAARAERGTAQLHFAFGATFPRSTLVVLGSDGALEVDLTRNLLCEERKSRWLEPFDAYLAGARKGRSLRRGARANLLGYLGATLGLAPRGDAFHAGMRESLRGFHAALRASQPPPADAESAARVLEWCEACVRDLPPSRPAPVLSFDPRPARAGEIVVLGANGFIGRQTVRALLARGLPVSAAVRRTGGLLEEDLARAVRAGELRAVRADLGAPRSIAAAVRGASVVLHLATGGGSTWEDVQRTMVAGTRAVAEACLEHDVARLVYVSSIAALYLGPGRERVEDDEPLDPLPEARAPYARGKIAAERELLLLHRDRGLRVTIVRPGVVLGSAAPLQHSGIGLWVRDNQCIGWGRGTRPLPLVLVDDVADALVRLAQHSGRDLDGRALNLAARLPLTAAELVREYARRTGRDFQFHPRPLVLSQMAELGKWLVKRAGGRRVPRPSYRDLASRSLYPALACRTARETLGWEPCEDAAQFLDRILSGR